MPVQPLKSLPDPGKGQRQIDAKVTRAVEHLPVLEGNTHIPSGLFHLPDSLIMRFTPLCTVHKKDVGALRFGDPDPVKAVGDVAAGPVHVTGEDLAQLIDPPAALRLVSPDEGVHRKDIHLIIMGEGGFLPHPLPDGFIVDNVVGAHQAGQIEGLGGGIEGHSAVPGVLADALGGNVPVAVKDEVGPDLVRNHHHVMLLVKGHHLFQLPALPDPASGVVGGTDDGGVDAVFHNPPLHILKVHPPDPLFVLLQGAVDHMVAVVGQAHSKADVGGGMDQDIVPPGAEYIQGANDPAQDAVLVADLFREKAGDAVAVQLPPDDGVIVFLCGVKVAKGGMSCPADNGLADGGTGGKVHICHPHGDDIKALPGQVGGKAGAGPQPVDGGGILTAPLHDRGKIVLHNYHTPVSDGFRAIHYSIKHIYCIIIYCKVKVYFSDFIYFIYLHKVHLPSLWNLQQKKTAFAVLCSVLLSALGELLLAAFDIAVVRLVQPALHCDVDLQLLPGKALQKSEGLLLAGVVEGLMGPIDLLAHLG